MITIITSTITFRYATPPDSFYINDMPVPRGPNFRYLGMKLDSRLSFVPYIASIKSMMSSRVNVMRAIARCSGGASDRVFLRFYTAVVKAHID